MLTIQPEIAQAMVYGDRRPHLVALLVPDPEIASAPDLHARLQSAVDRVNADVSVIEKVRRFILADEGFTIENEQLTPSMKIRRHVICEGLWRAARRALQALAVAWARGRATKSPNHAASDRHSAARIDHLGDIAMAQPRPADLLGQQRIRGPSEHCCSRPADGRRRRGCRFA